jgi:hypothetical protein
MLKIGSRRTGIRTVPARQLRFRPTLEVLEGRLTPAAPLYQFGVLGDFGGFVRAPDGPFTEQAVADLVRGWNPAFIITAGDNTYNCGLYSEIDADNG